MTESKTFGFDEEFQKKIVSAALKDPVFLLQYGDVLLPSYFDFDYLASVMRIALELAEKFNQVPTKVSVVEEVKEFCKKFNLDDANRDFLLNKIEEVYRAEIADFDFIQHKVVTFGQRQSLRAAILQVVSLLRDDTSDAAYDKASQIVENAVRTGYNTRDLGLSLYPNLERLPELYKASPSSGAKIPTGFPTLDSLTNGGPSRGEVWAIVGLSGRGKSVFLVNIGAAALKNGFAVIHITVGDLNQLDVAVRYAARLTMSTTQEVILGAEAYRKRAKIIARYNPHLHIKYFASDSANMGHVRSYISKVRAVEGFEQALTIVDYPEELQMPVEGNLYLSGGQNYSSLGRMAVEFNSLFWVASQPNNWIPKFDKDVIKESNLSESRKKLHKLDGMCSWNMDDEDELLGNGRLWVGKVRRGKSHRLIPCSHDLDRMLIRENTQAPAVTNVTLD